MSSQTLDVELTETPDVCVCVCVLCVGVYLSRYSDLLQVDPITPGATGEIIIFKVMKVRPQAGGCHQPLRTSVRGRKRNRPWFLLSGVFWYFGSQSLFERRAQLECTFKTGSLLSTTRCQHLVSNRNTWNSATLAPRCLQSVCFKAVRHVLQVWTDTQPKQRPVDDVRGAFRLGSENQRQENQDPTSEVIHSPGASSSPLKYKLHPSLSRPSVFSPASVLMTDV